MIPLAVLTLAIAGQQTKSTVSIVPQKESPFVLRDIKSNLFPLQYVIESREESKPGIYLIQESQFGEETYRLAKQSIEGSEVKFIVRQKSNGSIERWNMQGKRVEALPDDIPPDIKNKLKEGTIGILIAKPKRDSIDITSPSFQLMTSDGNYVSTDTGSWQVVSIPSVKDVDVMVSITAIYRAGTLSPEIGSQQEIDGIPFKVVDAKRLDPNSANDSRRIFQLRQVPRCQYMPRLEVDRQKLLKDFPNAENTNISIDCSVPYTNSPDTPKGAVEMFATSNQAVRFWKGITIIRRVQLIGYLGNVPTEPQA
jgi:hypothetical protein